MEIEIQVFSDDDYLCEEEQIPKNPLERPTCYLFRDAIFVLLLLIGSAVVFFGVLLWSGTPEYPEKLSAVSEVAIAIALSVAFLAGMILLFLKAIVVESIHIYQRYASDEIRLACVYYPSCSVYMLMAIEKYGVFRGIKKGIKRLDRCHFPNGGFDFP